MNVLFTVDNYFYKHPNGEVYSKGLYPYSVWERYLAVFDRVVVAARVVDFDEGQDLVKMNVSSGPNVSFIAIPSLNNPLNKLKDYSKAKSIISSALNDVDCLIARIPSEISSLAIKVADRKNKPWAVEVVSCTWDAYWNHGSLKGKIYAPFAALNTRRETRKAKHALYVTETFLQRRYPSEGETINCSNAEILEVDNKVLEKRLTRLRMEKRPIKIGFIGYLGTNIKGMDTALKALSIINHSFNDFEFHVLGGGDTTRWEHMAKELGLQDKTYFYGFIPSGQPVFEWIDEIDIYIHPSRQEGLPRAVIEVMSRGCPTIASNIGGIPELLPEECLHSPKDTKKLSEKLLYMINNDSFREKMARNNYDKAKQYTKNVLDIRRTQFWSEFKTYCEKL